VGHSCSGLQTCPRQNSETSRRQATGFETRGPLNSSALCCLIELGRSFCDVSGEEGDGLFLFQRLSILVQRYDAVLRHDSFVSIDNLDLESLQYVFNFSF
jgi:hypothetical protein